MKWLENLGNRLQRRGEQAAAPVDLPAAGEPAVPPTGETPPGVGVPPPDIIMPVSMGDGAPSASLPAQADTGARTDPTSKIFYRYYTDIHGTPDHTRAYEHGHVDGTHEGDPDAFRAVIVHAEQVARLDERLATARADLAGARADRDAFKALDARLAGAAHRLEHLEHTRDLAARDHLEATAFYDDAVATERDTRDRSPWANFYVYGLATIAFLIGDMMVSKEVVSQVLKLPDRKFLWLSEQWWFAIGIALLAMVVKLGYERLVEIPYQRGEKRSFKWAANLSILLTVATLAVLGWTRSFYTDQMGQTGPSLADALRGTVPVAAASHETPWLIVLAFMMTAVLFAVTGGLCGGVAAQAWHVERNERRPARRRVAETRTGLNEARGALAATEQAVAVAREAHAADERTVSHFPALDVLDARVGEAEGAVATTAQALHEVRTLWLTALYDSGFALAEANRVYLDKAPQDTMRRLSQLTADVLRAMQADVIAESDGQSLLYAIEHATKQHLGGDLTLDGYRTLLDALEDRLGQLVAAGPPRVETWATGRRTTTRASGTAGARPFVEARQTMARL